MKITRIFLICLFECTLGFNGFTSLYNTHDEPHIDSDDYKSLIRLTVKEKWMKQKLDHFNAEDSRVWDERYLENDRFFTDGGPIFIFCGGEWEISPSYISTGIMFEMAQELNGTMFYTEHRYYGKSHPTDDTSTANLEFLSVDQALADMAHFIRSIKESSEGLKNSKVILVGASYSATFATWARLIYPDLVAGAWSSSAPVLAKVDFFEYNEVMTESLRLIGGEKCLQQFEDAFKAIDDYISHSDPTTLAKLEKDFKLCEPLVLTRDIPHFQYELSDTVAGLVQSHRFGEIEKACEFLLNGTHSDAVVAFGAWVNSKSTKKCLNMNYDDMIKKFNNVTWGSEANKQMRQWTYQTCGSFGWFQSGSSRNHIFGSKYPDIEYFIKLCNDLFNNRFTLESIEKNVENTNKKFGGCSPNISNVYSTHGQLDPWRALGLQKDLNPDAPAVVIDLYSHVPDLLSINAKDTPQMKESKARVKKLIKSWLNLS